MDSTCDADLQLHQIEAGDRLGHGVLDLQARVDLEEEVVVSGNQKSTVPTPT
jgi:hypothetical protein